ncbi:MAG: tRNA (guanosine(46)-N7)-methyltransferase TrmB [Psychroflexus sp.]
MGSKNKLKRFKDNEVFDNVVQPTRSEIVDETYEYKGKWKQEFFKNDNPLILELGCGKGEYTVGLAKRNPECNFLGIDIKGARFWRGAKTALEEEMSNVGFLRTQIELVDQVFEEGEVDEIWITFPDPQIKWKRTKHRMTNPDFLDKYKRILTKEGIIHLKTDSEFMHGYTLGILEGLGHDIIYAHHDIYVNHEAPEEVVGIQTFYEQQYLDIKKSITYLKFRLKP